MITNTLFKDYKGNFNKLRDGEVYLYKDIMAQTPFKAYIKSHEEKKINKPVKFAASSVKDLFGIIQHGYGLSFGNTDFIFETRKKIKQKEENFPVSDYINITYQYLTK
ncbi:MAG: hypothetical protein ACOC1P_04485 [Minisyncoccales bacterium]